jgi:MFS family permease
MKTEIGHREKFLLAASFIGTLAESMLTPIYAPLAAKVGGSILDAGVGFAVFSMTTGLFVGTVGLTQWFHRNVKKLMVFGFVLAGLGDLGYLLVRTKFQLFAVQAIVGLAIGILNPAWDSIYSEDTSKENSTRKWSLWTGGVSFMTGLSALLGGAIVTRYSFEALFITMFLLDLAAVWCSIKVARLTSAASSAPRRAGCGKDRNAPDWHSCPGSPVD